MIIQLDESKRKEFVQYCQTYRYVHDESYLYEEDLSEFEIGDKNPTILYYEGDRLKGVISLMLTDYFVAGDKGRIRIWHVEEGDIEIYNRLFEALRIYPLGVSTIELFMPRREKIRLEALKALGFHYVRTAYVMILESVAFDPPFWPEGYTLRPFISGQDEGAYAMIRNTAFRDLQGSTVPLTLEMVKEQVEEAYVLPEGIQFLCYQGEPVGLIRMIREDDEKGSYSFVAPICILPDHQGRGLGTMLLRAGLLIGQACGLNQGMLSVNGENDQALKLYKKLGFIVDMAVECHQYDL